MLVAQGDCSSAIMHSADSYSAEKDDGCISLRETIRLRRQDI